jgi:putative acyl-CoA dehydrogenase
MHPYSHAELYAETHEVTNQVPDLKGVNLYRADLPLQEWLHRFGGSWADPDLAAFGQLTGNPLMLPVFWPTKTNPYLKAMIASATVSISLNFIRRIIS